MSMYKMLLFLSFSLSGQSIKEREFLHFCFFFFHTIQHSHSYPIDSHSYPIERERENNGLEREQERELRFGGLGFFGYFEFHLNF